MDRALHAAVGRSTHGISPIVLARAYVDWLVHLGLSPGKQAQLVDKAARKALRFALYAARAAKDSETPACIQPLPQDHRFDHPAWRQPPFNLIQQSFLLTQQWWYNATTGLRGMHRFGGLEDSALCRRSLYPRSVPSSRRGERAYPRSLSLRSEPAHARED
jgi:polyhydroxyalkanoate synthase